MDYELYNEYIQRICGLLQGISEEYKLDGVGIETWHGEAPCVVMTFSDKDGISRNINVLIVKPSLEGATFRIEVNAWSDSESARKWINIQMGDHVCTTDMPINFKGVLFEALEKVSALDYTQLVNESGLY